MLLLTAGGCASSPPKPAVLSLQSASTGHGFAQTFPHAYFSQSDDGDREILLVNDGLTQHPADQAAGPLQPVKALPLAQFMHFKILWNPLPGTHTDAPSTTNAVIDWTVRASPPGQQGDSLHYRGAGFVQIDGDSQRLWLTIRNATLQLTSRTGSLVDPLGTCSVSGKFEAVRNDGLVQGTLADLNGQPAAAPVDAAAQIGPTASGPPPRSPAP